MGAWMVVAFLMLLAGPDAGVTLGPPEAMAAAQAIHAEWINCVARSAAKYGKLNEPVDTLADVIMSDCQQHDRAERAAFDHIRIVDGPPLADSTKDAMIGDSRRSLRASVVKALLDARLKAAPSK